MARYLLLILLLLSTGRAFADGGRMLFREPAGPFIVTFFTTPDPLTVNRADFSLAIERPNTAHLIEHAHVTFILTPQKGKPLVLHATHGQATTRFLQAANFTLPSAGLWRIKVIIRDGNQTGICYGHFRVLKQDLATNKRAWQIAFVPIMVLLFFAHQWRKRVVARQKAARLSAS